MDPNFQCFYNRGNQGRPAGMYENDGISALNAQLDMLTYILEQKRNVNAFKSNHVICDLRGVYHATYECMQAPNDEFGHTILILINATLVRVILMNMVGIIIVHIVNFQIHMIINTNVSNMNPSHPES